MWRQFLCARVWEVRTFQRVGWYLCARARVNHEITLTTLPHPRQGRLSVHPGRLEVALKAVVDRHEVLRTAYVEHRNDGVFQRVSAQHNFHLQTIDLSGSEEEDAAERAAAVVEAACNRPFALGNQREAVIRAVLVTVAPGDQILVINAHHIAIDGLSWDVLAADLSAAYAGASLPPLPIQYGDYSVWEAAFMGSQAYRDQLAYWRSYLGTDPEPLDLPTDRPRPPVQTDNGASLVRSFPGLGTEVRSGAGKG